MGIYAAWQGEKQSWGGQHLVIAVVLYLVSLVLVAEFLAVSSIRMYTTSICKPGIQQVLLLSVAIPRLLKRSQGRMTIADLRAWASLKLSDGVPENEGKL